MNTTNNASPADLAAEIRALMHSSLMSTKNEEKASALLAQLQALAEAGQGEPVEDVAADVYEQLADMIAPHVTETPNGLPGSVVGSFAVLLDHWLSTRPAAAVEKPAEPRRRGHFYPGFTAEESHAENVRVYGKDALSDEELRAARLCQDEPGSGAHGLSGALASKPDARRVVREGWKLVPEAPTREMLNAAIDVHGHKLCEISAIGFRMSPQMMLEKCFGAMLAAAPEAPDARRVPDDREALADVMRQMLTELCKSREWHPQYRSKYLAVLAGIDTLAAAPEAPEVRKLLDDKIGAWLSAALEDPTACAEFKADILEWMAAQPNAAPEGK